MSSRLYYKLVGSTHNQKHNDQSYRLVQFVSDEPHPDTDDTTTRNDTGGLVHEWVTQTVEMLHQQWPQTVPPPTTTTTNGGGAAANGFENKIVTPHHHSKGGLPCSYQLMLCHDSTHEPCQVIGHGRLTDCFTSAGGTAAAVTFVLIHAAHRRRGWGRILMTVLQDEAQRLGYQYLYLWTTTAVDFYRRHLGYQPSHRVSLKRTCLKSLHTHQVQSLEDMIRQKSQPISSRKATTALTEPAQSQRPVQEVIPLLSSSCESNDEQPQQQQETDVWLCKRLVEETGSSLQVPVETRFQELEHAIPTMRWWRRDHAAAAASSSLFQNGGSSSSGVDWCYQFHSVPWQAQIGPSCGLAALRMVRDYFVHQQQQQNNNNGRPFNPPTSTASEPDNVPCPSLLTVARDRGYTQDGEVFDIRHLQTLARDVCGLDCELHSTRNDDHVSVRTLYRELVHHGSLWILPYDSNPCTKQPSQLKGQGAHYGIVVGMLAPTKFTRTKASDKDRKTITTANTNADSSHHHHATKEPTISATKSVGNSPIHWHSWTSWDMAAAAQMTSTNHDTPLDQDDDDHDNSLPLVQHSLSQSWAIASWKTFLESNQQLISVNERKFGSQQQLNLKDHILLCKGILGDKKDMTEHDDTVS